MCERLVSARLTAEERFKMLLEQETKVIKQYLEDMGAKHKSIRQLDEYKIESIDGRKINSIIYYM